MQHPAPGIYYCSTGAPRWIVYPFRVLHDGTAQAAGTTWTRLLVEHYAESGRLHATPEAAAAR
jgi:hypothetical protein